MPKAHLYIFSDASPSDWLEYGKDEQWHTIANYVFQSDPELQELIDRGRPYYEVLQLDNQFGHLFSDLQKNGKLRKWKTGPSYKSKFIQSFSNVCQKYRPIISVCSFREKVLRQSENALFKSYNSHIGGVEGRGIGFEKFYDIKKHLQMEHSFVNFSGFHKIVGPENKILVLLFLSWFIADQYIFFKQEIVDSGKYGFDQLSVTVVSDKLSSDGKTEELLRHLIDPEGEGAFVKVTQSPKSDTYVGDLLTDNIAGWLNSSIIDPKSDYAKSAVQLAEMGIMNGWHILTPSKDKLESARAVDYLKDQSTLITK